MIRKLTESDRVQVLEYLYQEASLNIFIIGDIENFGFDTDFQTIYGEFIDEQYQSVLLFYKENVIYYSHELSFNEEYLPIINAYPYGFISGRKALTDILEPYFSDMKVKPMYFSEVNEFQLEDELEAIESSKDIDISLMQSKEEAAELFYLLNTITEFDSMQKETVEKFVEGKMQNLPHSPTYYIRKDGIIVATACTVADTKNSAMVVAVATHIDYRKQGLASKVMVKLLHEYLVNRQKSLCLFYDNPAAGKIYHRLGFVDKDMWVMLVKK